MWIENDVVRPFIAARESDFRIADLISNDRILIVKCDVGKADRSIIAAALTTKIWSAVASRPSAEEREMMRLEGIDVPDFGADEGESHNEFFLVTDEFHAVASDDMDIGEMLAMARKKRLGLYLLTQQLSQLNDDQVKQILGNCSTILTFDPGREPDECRTLAKGLKGVSEEDLGVGRYKFWTVLTKADGDDSEPFLTYSTPPYPPLRSVKEANEIINESQRRYGSARLDDEDMLAQIPDEFAVGQTLRASSTPSGIELIDDRRHAILESIFAVRVRRPADGDAESVSLTAVREQLVPRLELDDYQLDGLLQAANAEGVVDISPDAESISLTRDGRRKLFCSGNSGSAGRLSHQALIDDCAIAQ